MSRDMETEIPKLYHPKAAANGFTPLHDACYSRNLSEIKRLLKAGADPNLRDIDGWTPIMWLMELPVSYFHFRKTKRMFRILLSYGADPFVESAPGWNPQSLVDRPSDLFRAWVSRELARKAPRLRQYEYQ